MSVVSVPAFQAPRERPSTAAQLLALAAVTSVEFLENGLVLFGAGPIMAGAGVSASAFALVYAAYGAAAVFMLYKHQWLVERLGYRRFVALSLLVFGLGSGVCATSPADGSVLQLALGRLLQGLGGSTFFVAGRMLINELPPERRFQGLLTFVCALLGGTALAPLLAAALLGLGGWRALFWFGLVWAALVGWSARGCLPAQRSAPHERSQEHWGWLLVVLAGVCGLQWVIQQIPVQQAGALSGRWLAVAGVSTGVLSLFAWRQWGRERPLINYRGLVQQRYLVGLVFYALGYFLAGAMGLLLPWMLHQELGFSLLATALWTSLGLCSSVGMALAHIFVARRWPRHQGFMLSGVLLQALACLLLSQVQGGSQGPAWSVLALCLGTVLSGLSLPLFIGPVAQGTFLELPPAVFSHGYQVKNIVRQLSLSFSVALLTGLLHQLGEGHLAGLAGAVQGLGAWLGTPVAQPAACVFLLLAFLSLPLALAVLLQRVFR
ncbi:MFS transporter [Curvibacter gracilis]|uniref:MFS transporter n=1 Tax=Curvibacter gracilis TaxID=230310 RepID=UPI000487BED0|nr:MFS transporter [Curvibacter gracilis]